MALSECCPVEVTLLENGLPSQAAWHNDGFWFPFSSKALLSTSRPAKRVAHKARHSSNCHMFAVPSKFVEPLVGHHTCLVSWMVPKHKSFLLTAPASCLTMTNAMLHRGPRADYERPTFAVQQLVLFRDPLAQVRFRPKLWVGALRKDLERRHPGKTHTLLKRCC